MIIALAGGVGGAKLARGLAAVRAPDDLTVVVNTGDDFEHLGLHISPDIDTVIYTLAGLNDRERGWGLSGESWNFMASVSALGGPDWFNLGDRDLATHVLRTERLRRGETLSEATTALAQGRNLRHAIVPMSDQPVRSMVETDEGELSFQDYFVRLRCAPRFRCLRLDGVERAQPSPAFAAALAHSGLRAIVICPSNPILSIGPILAVPGIREALKRSGVPVVAVSPFVGGEAIKGPAAKIMRELGIEPTPAAVADAYGGLLDGLVIDARDEDLQRADGLCHLVTDTLMKDDADQIRLADEVCDFALAMAKGDGP